MTYQATMPSTHTISPTEATDMLTSGHLSLFWMRDRGKPRLRDRHPASLAFVDRQTFRGATLSGSIARMRQRQRYPRSHSRPSFISRSLVMNCCGRSQIPGALYPMERAMSATKALQL